ncbi:MAG: DUF4331 domain-containing protein [Segetibacter sp.]
MKRKIVLLQGWKLCLLLLFTGVMTYTAQASSHREAPLISTDPLADNTDVYAFRSPDDTTMVTIIANYVPLELPEGGPTYYTFGSNIRYEIHIKNNATTTGDDITYRFTFSQVNEDSTTFFRIRLGKENLKTTYMVERSLAGGAFTMIANNLPVAPPNIGPRSIEGNPVGLGTTYGAIMQSTIKDLPNGAKVYAGPVDDPFFVDLAGVLDLANVRPEFNANNNNTVNPPKDKLARFNVHTIALKIPINILQKDGKSTPDNILDPNFVIGVWASASRQQIETLNTNGTTSMSGNFVQVSRLGMPLTNEAVIPIGMKDKWNTVASNSGGESQFMEFFKNPELALYMDDAKDKFGSAVPALNALRIQSASLGMFDFRNGKKGLFGVKGTPAAEGTAFGSASPFKDILLPDSMSPRAVDLLPIFLTGVPNLRPYQLATGKNGNPLAAGKPFINNFLPTLGDMLRLNMAVPVTPRNSADFSSLGLVQAAVLGITDSRFNASPALQNIPNMDGFPNGRRLEDDVTTIELQAVSGIVLAALGLWYDDFKPGTTASPVTPSLMNVLNFNAGVTKNDTTLRASFPYEQMPWRGFDYTLKPRF